MKVFIAGPNQVQEEKEIARSLIGKFNEILKGELVNRIDTFSYEKDVIPTFGEDGQSITNEQLVNKCDLLILIMHSNFGSATKRYESGTYEEFKIFLEKYKSGEKVDLMIYFKTAPVSVDTPPEELSKIQSFKKEVRENGGFFSIL